jgi:hypothetical protein
LDGAHEFSPFYEGKQERQRPFLLKLTCKKQVLFSLLALGAKPKENAMRLTLSSTMFLKPKENPMKWTLRVTVFAKPKVMN